MASLSSGVTDGDMTQFKSKLAAAGLEPEMLRAVNNWPGNKAALAMVEALRQVMKEAGFRWLTRQEYAAGAIVDFQFGKMWVPDVRVRNREKIEATVLIKNPDGDYVYSPLCVLHRESNAQPITARVVTEDMNYFGMCMCKDGRLLLSPLPGQCTESDLGAPPQFSNTAWFYNGEYMTPEQLAQLEKEGVYIMPSGRKVFCAIPMRMIEVVS